MRKYSGDMLTCVCMHMCALSPLSPSLSISPLSLSVSNLPTYLPACPPTTHLPTFIVRGSRCYDNSCWHTVITSMLNLFFCCFHYKCTLFPLVSLHCSVIFFYPAICSMFFPVVLWDYGNEHKYSERVQEVNSVKLVCRNTVELEIRQDATQQRGIRKYVGPLLVTIQELDGTFRHTLQVEGTVAKADITCHSKSRRNKKKKIPLCTGEEVDMDLSAMEWVTFLNFVFA